LVHTAWQLPTLMSGLRTLSADVEDSLLVKEEILVSATDMLPCFVSVYLLGMMQDSRSLDLETRGDGRARKSCSE
jgi:hypothetical protein